MWFCYVAESMLVIIKKKLYSLSMCSSQLVEAFRITIKFIHYLTEIVSLCSQEVEA